MQLSEELYIDIDWIANIEDKLYKSTLDAEVDGHDIGGGEMNTFIHCNDPTNTFKVAKNIFEERLVALENLKAAYREIGEDRYSPLWPPHLNDFKVL